MILWCFEVQSHNLSRISIFNFLSIQVEMSNNTYTHTYCFNTGYCVNTGTFKWVYRPRRMLRPHLRWHFKSMRLFFWHTNGQEHFSSSQKHRELTFFAALRGLVERYHSTSGYKLLASALRLEISPRVNLHTNQDTPSWFCEMAGENGGAQFQIRVESWPCFLWYTPCFISYHRVSA
jgi:hypothetical protein